MLWLRIGGFVIGWGSRCVVDLEGGSGVGNADILFNCSMSGTNESSYPRNAAGSRHNSYWPGSHISKDDLASKAATEHEYPGHVHRWGEWLRKLYDQCIMMFLGICSWCNMQGASPAKAPIPTSSIQICLSVRIQVNKLIKSTSFWAHHTVWRLDGCLRVP